MTPATTARRPGAASIVMVVASLSATVAILAGINVVLLTGTVVVPIETAIAIALFNVTAILQSAVGATIEWRRPGHAIGRLLMLSGPLYAIFGASWMTGGPLGAQWLDPAVARISGWTTGILAWAAIAVTVAWIPLLFPTGTLPGPRWRGPVAVLASLFGVGLVAQAAQFMEGPTGTEVSSAVIIATAIALLALVASAGAAIVVRYRRGDLVERLQIRWLGAAIAICVVGFTGSATESAFRGDDGPLLMLLVLYVGILAIPIAIGTAVLRYRLYEIDRLISRTLSWALVTGVLLVAFATGVVALQAVLEGFTQGETLAVAASTLVVFALFQPVRRRVQRIVDRRFDRARYDGQKVVDAFARQLRDEVDLDRLRTALVATADDVVRPVSASVWLRSGEAGR